MALSAEVISESVQSVNKLLTSGNIDGAIEKVESLISTTALDDPYYLKLHILLCDVFVAGKVENYHERIRNIYLENINHVQFANDNSQTICRMHFKLAELYLNKNLAFYDKREGDHHLRIAVDGGDHLAKARYGWDLLNGIDIEKNPIKGFKYLSQAETRRQSKSDADLLYRLGLCYFYGNGTQQDTLKGYKYFQQCLKADANHSQAIASAAYCLYTGEGVAKNKKAAIALYVELKGKNSLLAEEALDLLEVEKIHDFPHIEELRKNSRRFNIPGI